MEDAVLVMGYNNTRIDDVKKIKEKALHCLNAKTILCKKDLKEIDRSVSDFAIDVGLEQTDENLKIIVDLCSKNHFRIIAILPFSDQGTQLGTKIAHYLNLPGANPEKIKAALDKYHFRNMEQIATKPKSYIEVNSRKITSLTDLQTAFKEFNSAIFLKPIAEGNSRGCLAIKKFEDCEPAWNEVKKYLASGGVTAETLIENAQEYSWEHVAGYSWLTEKKTTQTRYRAEPQHILPAPNSDNEKTLLLNGAKFMAEICGYNGCACHNEIFLLSTKDKVMAVEPNLRPAGGKVWDLSMHAFENFDPWSLWILWAAGKIDNTPKTLKQKAFAGMRFITARKDGIIKKLHIHLLEQLKSTIAGDFIELMWSKKPGDTVTSNPRDNADFLGFITAKADNYENLTSSLLQAESILLDNCEIEE